MTVLPDTGGTLSTSLLFNAISSTTGTHYVYLNIMSSPTDGGGGVGVNVKFQIDFCIDQPFRKDGGEYKIITIIGKATETI